MGLHSLGWHNEAHDRAAAIASQNLQSSAYQFGALAHAYESDTLVASIRRKSFTAIFDFQAYTIDFKF
jgi:hypothetical protein